MGDICHDIRADQAPSVSFFLQSGLRSTTYLGHGMSKCTVYLVVFAEDLNVEIDTHVIRNYGLDGWDGLVEDSKLKRGNLLSRQGLPCTP